MASPTIRPAQPEDFPQIVEIYNDHHPHAPTTLDEYVAARTTYPDGTRHDLDVLEVGGQVIAYGFFEDNFWSKAEHQWSVGARARLSPEMWADTRVMLEFQMAKAAEVEATELLGDSRTDRPEEMELYRSLGFSEGMRFPQSELDLTDFDPAPFQSKLTAAHQAGLEIVPMAEFIARFPTTWKVDLHAFEEEVKHDVPWEDGFEDLSFEDFLKSVENPLVWQPEGRFVALDGDQLAGMTELDINRVDPSIASTDLTAVRRPYRRLGLATALKVTSLGWARENGVQRVETNNEEKNPMFQLNLALGFRDIWFWVALKKRVR